MPDDNISVKIEIELLYGPSLANSELILALLSSGAQLREVASLVDLRSEGSAVLLLDADLLQQHALEVWRHELTRSGSDCMILAESSLIGASGADLQLPAGLAIADSLKIVRFALNRWVLRRENSQLRAVLSKTEEDLRLLTEISIALSGEKDLKQLLEKILGEAQYLACCDAASLFLVEKREGAESVLKFKVARNDSLATNFTAHEMVVDRRSIAGYVAASNNEINIPDAYDIESSAPYGFNAEVDRSMGYRTVSILAFPLRNYRGEVIGVLQFINRKLRREAVLDSTAASQAETVPFDDSQLSVLRALASQSAVAIENNVLLEDINNLFSSFVQASVAAVEQRDPTTSGHSFRVADLCTELAIKLSHANLPDYQQVKFGEAELKELRYAALLHDFGKLGVSERILTKGQKLPDRQFELIRYRIRLTQENLRRQMYEQMLHAVKDGADSRQIAALEKTAAAELNRLDKYLSAIELANVPLVEERDPEFLDHLVQAKAYPFQGPDESEQFILSEQEFEYLSIRRGSLSQAERREVESHVVHTASFLRLIPWTPELARIPELAEAHHEKLDGSGYPLGMRADEIPVGSKIMAVTDIYDALTASDRPYKASVPKDIAYKILCDEAAAGRLDAWLVQLFIDADVASVLEGKDYAAAVGGSSNHPCDPELHPH